MNPFKKFILKSLLGDDFTEPNKAYSFLTNTNIGFGGFSFSSKNAKNFIQEGYVSNPDVYAVVSKIAQSFASVKWCVKTETRQGIEEVYDTELNRVLDCPNQLQTWSEFQESAAAAGRIRAADERPRRAHGTAAGAVVSKADGREVTGFNIAQATLTYQEDSLLSDISMDILILLVQLKHTNYDTILKISNLQFQELKKFFIAYIEYHVHVKIKNR